MKYVIRNQNDEEMKRGGVGGQQAGEGTGQER
jgi:hypothetical protein